MVYIVHVFMKRARAAAQRAGLSGYTDDLAPLARGKAVSSVGSGLWFTVWALYLTHEARLNLSEAGIAMTIAGLMGFIAPVPLGMLADRRGTRGVYRALLMVEAVACLGFIVCTSFWPVTLVASTVAICAQGSSGISDALATQLAGEQDQIDVLARLRACSHAGQAVGAAFGAAVIAADARAGYVAAIVLNAGSFLLFCVDLGRVPSVPAGPRGLTRPRLGALSDLPFTCLAGICGVLCLCWGLMASGFPLWIADDTKAPHVLSGAIVFAGTVAIALGQTGFSRGYNTPAAAAGAAIRSGVALAACCLLLAVAAGPAGLPATGLLLCAGAAHILGELWFVAASRGFSVPLMDARRAAEYQSVFAAGEALAIMLAPALLTTLVIPHRTAGWCGLAALFILAALAAKPATRWATTARRIPAS